MKTLALASLLVCLAVSYAQLDKASFPLLLPSVYDSTDAVLQQKFDFYPGYSTLQTGKRNTTDAKVYFVSATDGRNFSSWTDVPIGLQETAPGVWTTWAVIEIPVNTTAKIETKTSSKDNPLVQDTNKEEDKDGSKIEVLRFYQYKPSLVNYGGVPQTWEDSELPDKRTGVIGDNDPVDLLEIGSVMAPMGSIIRVKILGALGLIDKGETDWKIVTINTKDPNAALYNDIMDVPKAVRDNIYDFFLNYKVPEGKGITSFFPAVQDVDKLFLNKTVAVEILQDKHAAYQRLLSNKCKTEDCLKLSYPGAAPKEKKKKDEPAASGRRLKAL